MSNVIVAVPVPLPPRWQVPTEAFAEALRVATGDPHRSPRPAEDPAPVLPHGLDGERAEPTLGAEGGMAEGMPLVEHGLERLLAEPLVIGPPQLEGELAQGLPMDALEILLGHSGS